MSEEATEANRERIETLIRDAILWAPGGKVWQEATTEERESAESAACAVVMWLIPQKGVLPMGARPAQTTAGVDAAKALGVDVPRHVAKAIYEAMAKQYWGEP